MGDNPSPAVVLYMQQPALVAVGDCNSNGNHYTSINNSDSNGNTTTTTTGSNSPCQLMVSGSHTQYPACDPYHHGYPAVVPDPYHSEIPLIPNGVCTHPVSTEGALKGTAAETHPITENGYVSQGVPSPGLTNLIPTGPPRNEAETKNTRVSVNSERATGVLHLSDTEADRAWVERDLTSTADVTPSPIYGAECSAFVSKLPSMHSRNGEDVTRMNQENLTPVYGMVDTCLEDPSSTGSAEEPSGNVQSQKTETTTSVFQGVVTPGMGNAKPVTNIDNDVCDAELKADVGTNLMEKARATEPAETDATHATESTNEQTDTEDKEAAEDLDKTEAMDDPSGEEEVATATMEDEDEDVDDKEETEGVTITTPNNDDEDDDDDEDEVVPRLTSAGDDIDRGMAWIVLVSAFLGMTIFGTFTFSTGIFQAEILQVVEPDVQKTSWVGASHLSTLCMMGPFAGLIKNRLGSRVTVVMSSIIICVGMVLASVSVNVTQLILTYGVITGIGTGMALNPMFVCVSCYFERYRGFASGVIAAGSGAGMFVGGPVIRHLIETYGLSGAFLIWGAVGLNIGVVGMVMRPSSLERGKARGTEQVLHSTSRMWGMDSAMLASVSTLPSAGGHWGSVLGLSSFRVWEKEADTHTLQHSQILLEVPPELNDVIHSCNELSVLTPEAMETAVRSTWLTRNFRSSQLSVGDSVGSASTGRCRHSPLLVRKDDRQREAGLAPQADDISLPDNEPSSLPKVVLSRLASLDLCRILLNPGFALYIFSASMWVFGESVVFTYLPTYAQAEGSSPFQSATLITAVGFTSTFSRLVVGFMAGNPSIGPDLMHVGMLGLCGLFTIFLPLYSGSFSGQLAFAGIYGLYSGGLASVINILIITFIGVEHIALAFGLICFGQGVASLAGPSISGAIVSGGGSYDDVFLFAGSLLLLAAISALPMVLFQTTTETPDEGDVEEARESTRTVRDRVRMKGESCHT